VYYYLRAPDPEVVLRARRVYRNLIKHGDRLNLSVQAR